MKKIAMITALLLLQISSAAVIPAALAPARAMAPPAPEAAPEGAQQPHAQAPASETAMPAPETATSAPGTTTPASEKAKQAPETATSAPETATPALETSAPEASPPSPQQTPTMSERFENAVNGWVAELSRQPGFEAWKDAKWTRQPLGAGLHGWIVTLTLDGRAVGYLVVAAEPEGRVSTRGIRPRRISPLRRAVAGSAAASPRPAAHPLLPRRLLCAMAVRPEGREAPFDAITGEQLPVNADALRQLAAETNKKTGKLTSAGRVVQAAELSGFDPYYNLSWIKEEPAAVPDAEALIASLDDGNRWICVAELYGGAVAFAYAVTGYHRWDGDATFIALEQDGLRFVPADTVLKHGALHRAAAEGEPIWKD